MISPEKTETEKRIHQVLVENIWAAVPYSQIHGMAQAAYEITLIFTAEMDAGRARIVELEGLLREAIPMLQNASALAAAVDDLARELPL